MKDKMNRMKIAFKAMKDKMKSLMRELKELNMIEREVEIIDNIVPDNNTAKDIKDEDTEIMTVKKRKLFILTCISVLTS